jgi:beta-lactamase regulating signal transducer with metallopeptidase domain
MEMILLQIITFQLIFLMVYELLLKKETFFNWNRTYLLSTSVLSVILPFIKIQVFSKVIPTEYVVNLPTVFIGDQLTSESAPIEQLENVLLQMSSLNYMMLFWSIGAVLCTCMLCYKLYKIGVFQYSNTSIKKAGYTITTLKNSEDAFSFLNVVFLGDQLKTQQKESILKHEKVHVQQKHTLDLLWFEALRIIFWFNPLIYIYQKRITEVHEFIADKSASKYQQNYYENLLAKTFNVAQFSLVNQFYSSSLIKKRIIMLTKKQSNRILKLKYVLTMPVIMIMLIVTSCESNKKPDSIKDASILEHISAIEESIAEKGTMSKKETAALKQLFELTTTGSSVEKNKDKEMSFKVLDKAPIFPECDENATSEELKTCFSKSISKHVAQNFNTKLGDDLNLRGTQKILVAFKIDKLGNINDVKVGAPHQALADEAKRVINLLPKLQPGMHDGKAVTVPYSLPIVFKIEA